MSLEALLTKLEMRSVTAVTDASIARETQKTAEVPAGTAVTVVTSKTIMAAAEPLLEGLDMRAVYEERAAIAEYGGGLSRFNAELQVQLELEVRRAEGVQRNGR